MVIQNWKQMDMIHICRAVNDPTIVVSSQSHLVGKRFIIVNKDSSHRVTFKDQQTVSVISISFFVLGESECVLLCYFTSGIDICFI